MRVAITGGEMLTCLGDTAATLTALAKGADGSGPLRFYDTDRINVTRGYHIEDGDGGGDEPLLRTGRWLAACVRGAVRQAGIDPSVQRVSVVVGTGLRELRAVERWALDGVPVRRRDLHFDAAVREVLPEAVEVLTVSNACSAAGHALALAQDLLAAGEADAVVAAGCDAMSESMLTMMGRVVDAPTPALQPFQEGRAGVLLGEGAAAVVLQRAEDAHGTWLAELLGTGLSCDAHHETAPDVAGIVAAMRDAHERAGVRPQDVGLVLAHGTGTALNDPTEAAALGEVFAGAGTGPLVTGIKGSVGHTSGSAALMSLLVAAEALRTGSVPATAGLRTPIAEAAGLRLVTGEPAACDARVAQVNAFGFGGVNAVSVIRVDG
ncbi:beta-ketoacyl synthase N-terminal-like domain-containing protein [Streptomyces sp. NPDC059506]|uniref:beta-ketoacyl synthase N-terminal-like domain-containing protein n=1 Tax=Streptomyces TaxID=1883 RepID=UPI00217517C9|nr:beta-ketoacyl synthase N-terminal-like domain-containing protein [Streptomyces sp. SCUT-3]